MLSCTQLSLKQLSHIVANTCSPTLGLDVYCPLEKYTFEQNQTKNIEKDAVVGITYTLKEANSGELVETVTQAQPFYFLFGFGNLLDEFERHLDGKSAGEAFDFQLSPEQSYGPVDTEAVVDLPVSAFMIQGRFAEEYVKEGEIIQKQDPEGNAMPGRVVKRGLETFTIDFNHPMAGKHLHFAGTVVEVRAATEEELDHGHVHGPGGHHH